MGASRVVLSGNGIANDKDRSTADSQAYNQAITNLNKVCPGIIDQSTVEKTNDTCGNLGSDDSPLWMCTVAVKGVCQAGR